MTKTVQIGDIVSDVTTPTSTGYVTERTGIVLDVHDDLVEVKLTNLFCFHPDYSRDLGRVLPIPAPWTLYKNGNRPYDPAIQVMEIKNILDK